MSTDKLMTYALNKFEILQKYEIVALVSVIEKLKDANIKLSKRFKTSPPGKVKVKFRVKFKKKGQKQSGKQSHYGKGKEECNKKGLKDVEANTKKFMDKTYFWFPNHQAYTIRLPEEFTLKT